MKIQLFCVSLQLFILQYTYCVIARVMFVSCCSMLFVYIYMYIYYCIRANKTKTKIRTEIILKIISILFPYWKTNPFFRHNEWRSWASEASQGRAKRASGERSEPGASEASQLRAKRARGERSEPKASGKNKSVLRLYLG